MLDISIPGFGDLTLEQLVLDYNGTIAVDGKILEGVFARMYDLVNTIPIHIVTADTHGNVRMQFMTTPFQVHLLPPGDEAKAKLDYVARLGPARCVCIGQGRNDRLMLAAAGLGICPVQEEGVSPKTLAAADVAVPSVLDAFDLLSRPNRLIATLRS